MPNLKRLHLGALGRSHELIDGRLESFWNRGESHPEELTLDHMHMTADSLQPLPGYKSLKALSIIKPFEVRMPDKHQ